MKCGASFILLSIAILDEHKPIQTPIVVDAFSTQSPFTTIKINNKKKTTLVRQRDALRGKWDNLVDDDDEEDGVPPPFPVPLDMVYNERNLKRQVENFQKISAISEPEDDLMNDVYVRRPESDECWLCGKIIRTSDVTIYENVLRQWSLIVHHARQMRPDVFDDSVWPEIWIAPGDSQFEVASNDESVEFREMNMEVIYENYSDGIQKTVKSTMVGFHGETFGNGIAGFRSLRDQQGKATQPEMESRVLQDTIDDRVGLPTEIQRKVPVLDKVTTDADVGVKELRESLDRDDLEKYLQVQKSTKQQKSSSSTGSSNAIPTNVNMMNQMSTTSTKINKAAEK
eukprot:CAMPEP_0194239018 /NCGR_PEP_ID=MMETSP0158-20130606/5612_1 /TAXON_ID=33649 /ORGANISM="Thalassionema nitzschioides, Strain L26-B" /LENGTH=340 /DNA_ID=CAMNT_0038973407 /DNA_START=40 /DNA_END=1059 /DNA_ORIENTATION=-